MVRRWACALAVVAVVGCRRAPPEPETVAPVVDAGPAPEVGARMNGATRTEPSGPGAPLQVGRPDVARVRVDLAGVRAGIREHQLLHDGANPPSIGAMDLRLSYPGDLEYDAAAGTVRSRTYPQF